MKEINFDVIEYLQSKRIPFWDEGNNCKEGWVNIQCVLPKCDDHSNHLGINLYTGYFNCWKCNSRGHVSRLIKIISNLSSLSQAEEIMLSFPKLNMYQSQEKTPGSICKLPNTNPFTSTNDLLTDFLIKRKLPVDYIKNESLGWTGPCGNYKYRIIFPLTYKKNIESFVGRDYTNISAIPYKNADIADSTIPAKNLLFGFDHLQHKGTIVVVEGIIDQLKLGPPAVSTLGVSFTKDQILLLRKLNPKKIIIAYDSDESGIKGAKNLASNIWFSQVEILTLENVSDPGELSVEEGHQLMKEIL